MFQHTAPAFPRKMISALAIIALAACLIPWGQALAADDDVVAKVNEQPITKADFYELLESTYGHEVLTQMIADALVEEAAKESKIEVNTIVEQEYNRIRSQYPDENTFMAALAENKYTVDSLRHRIKITVILDILSKQGVVVTDQEVLAYFEANKDSLGTPAQSQVSHILVDTLEQATQVKAKLDAGGNFAALAKEYSVDRETAVNGGDLGLISDDEEIVPEFRAAMDSLLLGQISEPVKTSYGYHIIMITGRTLARPAQFDKVKETVRAKLVEDKARSYDAVVQDLYNHYKVSVFSNRYTDLANQ